MLDSVEAAYEDTGEQEPIVFMASGEGFHDGNVSHWWDQKHFSIPIQNCSDNTNWETAAVHISVAVRKSTDRFNDPIDFLGYTNSLIYHADRFHTYRNCTNNMEPEVVDNVKRSIQEYAQHNSAMGGIRGSQGIQYGRGHASSTTTCFVLSERRVHLSQLWNKEIFVSVDQDCLYFK